MILWTVGPAFSQDAKPQESKNRASGITAAIQQGLSLLDDPYVRSALSIVSRLKQPLSDSRRQARTIFGLTYVRTRRLQISGQVLPSSEKAYSSHGTTNGGVERYVDLKPRSQGRAPEFSFFAEEVCIDHKKESHVLDLGLVYKWKWRDATQKVGKFVLARVELHADMAE